MPWLDSLWKSQKQDESTPARTGSILPTLSSTPPANASSTRRLSISELGERYTTTLSSALGLPPTHPLITILLPSAALTTVALTGSRVYRSRLRRAPTAAHIPPHYFRNRSLYGYVTSVGDGDNFRFFHAPGGRLAGWGWAPGRRYFLPVTPAGSGSSSSGGGGGGTGAGAGTGTADTGKGAATVQPKVDTLHVRLAGIDAPELAHFGRPEQPYGAEALDFLRGEVLHRWVRVVLYRRDQYERVVGSATVTSPAPALIGPLLRLLEGSGWGVVRLVFSPVEVVLRILGLGWNTLLGKRKADVSLRMLQEGMATIYEAKFGKEFGGKETEAKYRAAEAEAKRRKKGLWAGGQGRLGEAGDGQGGTQRKGRGWLSWLFGGKSAVDDGKIESPREYKNRMRDLEAGKAKK